ncbi:Hypothetical predicted protein, partial [Paramuricea clavata]
MSILGIGTEEIRGGTPPPHISKQFTFLCWRLEAIAIRKVYNQTRLDSIYVIYVKNFRSMSWRIWFFLLFVQLLMTFDICTGDDFDDCTEYVQIKNESLYDRDPKSVNDLSKRPLGFMSVLIPFETNNADAKNPCFTLSLDDSAKQTVQVLATSAVGDSSFCVKSQPPYSQPTCQS